MAQQLATLEVKVGKLQAQPSPCHARSPLTSAPKARGLPRRPPVSSFRVIGDRIPALRGRAIGGRFRAVPSSFSSGCARPIHQDFPRGPGGSCGPAASGQAASRRTRPGGAVRADQSQPSSGWGGCSGRTSSPTSSSCAGGAWAPGWSCTTSEYSARHHEQRRHQPGQQAADHRPAQRARSPRCRVLSPSAIGTSAKNAASAVITTGRTRIDAALRIASVGRQALLPSAGSGRSPPAAPCSTPRCRP